MKLSIVIVACAANALAAPSLIARDGGKFGEGQPIDADGKGGPIQGMSLLEICSRLPLTPLRRN